MLGLFQITIERLKCSKAISGLGWDGMDGWDGRKSLKALILRAPLCGANNSDISYLQAKNREKYTVSIYELF